MFPHAGILSGLGQTTGRVTPRRPSVRCLCAPVGLALATILPCFAALALAQSSPAPRILEFEQEGHDVKGVVLYATRREDGVERRIDLGVPKEVAEGRFRVPLPPLEAGSWRLELASYNDAGEGPRGAVTPPEIRLDSTARTTATTVKSTPHAHGEPKPRPAADTSAPAKKKKGGGLRKLWTVIVGDDKP